MQEGGRDSNFVRGRVRFTKVIYFTPVNTEYPATCGRGLHGPAGYLDNTSPLHPQTFAGVAI